VIRVVVATHAPYETFIGAADFQQWLIRRLTAQKV
jgi:hypothetical protein